MKSLTFWKQKNAESICLHLIWINCHNQLIKSCDFILKPQMHCHTFFANVHIISSTKNHCRICRDVALKLSLIELEMFGARFLTFKIFTLFLSIISCSLAVHIPLFQFGCGVCYIVLKHSFPNKMRKEKRQRQQQRSRTKPECYTWTLFDSIQFTRLYS